MIRIQPPLSHGFRYMPYASLRTAI
ncbi:CRISPR-associated DxTHG motif protein [Planococcus glaciei]|nr:CRISPR-associated DxTHG motif protein [Planococcus glaciei]